MRLPQYGDMNATAPTTKQRTQAQIVIEKFGGAAKLAALLHCEESTVYRWTYARANGGTDGLIPGKQLRRVLELARLTGVTITAQDLYPS